MARTSKPGGTKSRGASRGTGRRGVQADPASPAEARDKLGVTPAARPEAGPPAETPEPGADHGRAVFSIGSRKLAAGPSKLGKRRLNVLPDLPDIRDRVYQPHLRALRPSIYPALPFAIRDQGDSNSCTGQALAHVIDALLHREVLGSAAPRVSARMLYEMAKRNDEWTGTAYQGSSVRGAVSGFFRNGVCPAEAEGDDWRRDWVLTYTRAKLARECRLGAYFRVQPDLSDYHAALNEIGAIYVSAQIHANWERPKDGRIAPGGAPAGGHAFAVVGYDAEGFWVLNSWGPDWGQGGLAHWTYEDWAVSTMDAWVLQLGVRAPSAFSAIPRPSAAGVATPTVSRAPNRTDILGHFINIDDGHYVTGGRYGSPTTVEMGETVNRLTSPTSNGGLGFDHLVIYAHGGLNSLDDEASRIGAWKHFDIFGRNKIYNFHLMWGSGFLDEAFGALSASQAARASGFIGDLLFETGPGRALGRRAWRNMKQDAQAAFTLGGEYGGAVIGLTPLLEGLGKSAKRPVLHLVGHSAGSIVLGRLLLALKDLPTANLELGGVHLMAPACTAEFFNATFGALMAGKLPLKLKDKVYLYSMSAALELADKVGVPLLPSYSRSLLWLVSRAYEEEANTRIAGMQVHEPRLDASARLRIDHAVGKATASTTHGGFDNDVPTMTTIMSRILGGPVPHPPMAEELMGS